MGANYYTPIQKAISAKLQAFATVMINRVMREYQNLKLTIYMVNLVLNHFVATIVMKKEKIMLLPFLHEDIGPLKNNRFYKRPVQVKENLQKKNGPRQANINEEMLSFDIKKAGTEA